MHTSCPSDLTPSGKLRSCPASTSLRISLERVFKSSRVRHGHDWGGSPQLRSNSNLMIWTSNMVTVMVEHFLGHKWNNHLSCSWLATSPWNLPSSSLTCLRRQVMCPHLAIRAGGIYQWALQTRNDPGKSIVKTGISNLGNHHIFRLSFGGVYLGILQSISYSCGSPSGGHIYMKSVQSVPRTKPRKIQHQISFHKPTICQGRPTKQDHRVFFPGKV